MKKDNILRQVSDSVQYINTTSHNSSIKISLSYIALTYINLNGQVTVTEPQDYTEEGKPNFECVYHSIGYIYTTSRSTSSGACLLDIALIDMNVNSEITVSEPQEYTKFNSRNV